MEFAVLSAYPEGASAGPMNQNVGQLNDFRFGGHQSFALRIAWLPKAAMALEDGVDPFSDPLRGVVDLGLGKNMVEALRCWIEAYGVAQRDGGRWVLTDEGEIVFGRHGCDRFLEDPRTLWWLHWRVATGAKARFFAWELMTNRWNEPTFTAAEVVAAFSRESARIGRTLAEISLRQHFDVWLRTYLAPKGGRIAEDNLDSPLAALSFIRHAGDREGPGRKEPVYAFDLGMKRTVTQALFRYCICDWWNGRPGTEDTAPFSDLLSGPSSPGRVFRMPEREVRDRLISLSANPGFEFDLVESLNQTQLRRRHKLADRVALLRSVYDDGSDVNESYPHE